MQKRLRLPKSSATGKKVIVPSRSVKKSNSTKRLLTAIKHRHRFARRNIRVDKANGKVITSSFFRPRPLIHKIASYAAIIAILTVGTLSSFYAFDLRIGNEVIVNGSSVGLISDDAEFAALLTDVRNLIIAAADGMGTGSSAQDLDVTFIPRIVRSKDVTSEFTLRQNMLAGVDQMVHSYAIYVNGELICSCIEEEDAFEALSIVRGQYNKGGLLEAEFLDEVSVRKEFVPITQVLPMIGVIAALNGMSQHREFYTATTQEDLANIADRFNMTIEQIREINSGIDDIAAPGVKVNVLKTQSVINVQTKSVEKYKKEMDYAVNTVNDSSLLNGTTTVSKKGRVGISEVTATVISVNGQEVERIPISEIVSRQPIDEVVRVGTKKGVAYVAAAASSGFLRPATGEVTSVFGMRGSEMHTGLDIGATYGAAVRAAIGGTVILSGWNGNYGLAVRVDSGGGMLEIYAHCSELLVTEGDVVRQGDVIARVGNTGRSTGTHLHFEIRKNGTPVNPAPYID
ncbi:MAG: peptidoglycan DD-metalloendopeptidase family protein [Clostridiales bacterium]|nr:peptidoglycan DD-metalloendopeptidase family protein [Clostridiales bacterium]